MLAWVPASGAERAFRVSALMPAGGGADRRTVWRRFFGAVRWAGVAGAMVGAMVDVRVRAVLGGRAELRLLPHRPGAMRATLWVRLTGFWAGLS